MYKEWGYRIESTDKKRKITELEEKENNGVGEEKTKERRVGMRNISCSNKNVPKLSYKMSWSSRRIMLTFLMKKKWWSDIFGTNQSWVTNS